MKNRSLLFGLLVLTFCACVFVLTTSGTFRNFPGQSEPGSLSDDLKAGWSYMAQLRGNQATGQVNPADVIKARNQAKELKSSAAIGLNWTSMGPDNVSGRTRAIIIDNRDNTGKTIITGSVSGGLWKSTTGGLTWNQIQTGGNILNVSCIAQAQVGDIYVGTGETFSSERLNLFSGFIGQGIYKSTDGNTFTKLASTNPSASNNPSADWAFVNKIAAGNNGVVLAATNNGLRFSSDGGQNWVFAKTGTQNLSGNSTEVKIGPDGTIAASVDNLLYISANGTSDGFVLRSTGAGQDSLPSEGIGRIEVAFAPSEASTIYALMVSDGSVTGTYRGQLRGIFVSHDKGSTWKVVGPGGSVLFNVFGNSTTGINYGQYAGCIVVNPVNPNKIYVGGVTVWEGTRIQETGFYQWQERSNFEGLYYHSIAINPNNTQNIYFSTDMGVGVTSDNFESGQSLNRNYKTSMFYTVAFDDRGRTLGGTQGSGVVYIDGQGNTPENASRLSGNFIGGTVDMSMVNPAAVFYSSTGGQLSRSNDYGESEANSFLYGTEVTNLNAANFITPFKLWESFNNVNSRDSVTFKATKNHNAGDVVIAHSKNHQFPFKYTLPVNLNNGDTLKVKDIVSSLMFVGTTNAVYMSRNILNFSTLPSWDRIANITGVPSAIAFSSDANYVYVGTTDGKLVRIANVALAYDSVRADVRSTGCIINNSVVKDFGLRYVTSIAVDPHNDNHVIVTLGNYGNTEYVFRSTNALSQNPDFNPVQGNLPKMPVYSAIIEMNNSNRVILGTEMGVYSTESLSASPSWSAENTGLGTIPVMSVRQQTTSRPWIENFTGVNNFGAIYIATHGNGIFENRLFVGIDGPDINEPTISKTLKVYPNPVQSEVNFSLSFLKNEHIKIEIFNLNGTLVKSLETGVLRGDRNISVSADGLSNGTYILKITSETGIHVGKFVVTR